MTLHQKWTTTIVGNALQARDEMDGEGYAALLRSVQAWMTKEQARLVQGEALRALRDALEGPAE